MKTVDIYVACWNFSFLAFFREKASAEAWVAAKNHKLNTESPDVNGHIVVATNRVSEADMDGISFMD